MTATLPALLDRVKPSRLADWPILRSGHKIPTKLTLQHVAGIAKGASSVTDKRRAVHGGEHARFECREFL
jgi:hypothetical protein